MVFYKVETTFRVNMVESVSENYLGFKDEAEAKKYFTRMEEYFTECRKYLKRNVIGRPVYTEVSEIPRRRPRNANKKDD